MRAVQDTLLRILCLSAMLDGVASVNSMHQRKGSLATLSRPVYTEKKLDAALDTTTNMDARPASGYDLTLTYLEVC
jgi:hypothetical protein